MTAIYIVIVYPINSAPVEDSYFFLGGAHENYRRALNRLAELHRQGVRAAIHEHFCV